MCIISAILNYFFPSDEDDEEDDKEINSKKHYNDDYEEQLDKCTKCEKVYYKMLYKNYHEKYLIKTQVYLRSLFPGYKAENFRIDIVFRNLDDKETIALIEINDGSHSRDLLRSARDKELKEFCNDNDINLITLWTKYGCKEKSICNYIDRKIEEFE